MDGQSRLTRFCILRLNPHSRFVLVYADLVNSLQGKPSWRVLDAPC